MSFAISLRGGEGELRLLEGLAGLFPGVVVGRLGDHVDRAGGGLHGCGGDRCEPGRLRNLSDRRCGVLGLHRGGCGHRRRHQTARPPGRGAVISNGMAGAARTAAAAAPPSTTSSRSPAEPEYLGERGDRMPDMQQPESGQRHQPKRGCRCSRPWVVTEPDTIILAIASTGADVAELGLV
ncbi:hypothetical protein ACFFGH_10790 [Lysobacter korlensis]|uniref:Uncharacterized protein n=1 Tax=Lysobacter korlensis TaxID=553636 RepID=A0ABV6RMZ1_9GAMM